MSSDVPAYRLPINLVLASLFVLVLVVGLIVLIAFMIRSGRNNGPRNMGPLKNGYSTKLVSDTVSHDPVLHVDLACPREDTKYSYTFFLKIDDFYCNRGYWKCIMIKGSSVNTDAQKCSDTIESTSIDSPFPLDDTCFPDSKFTNLEKPEIKKLVDKLKKIGGDDGQGGIQIKDSKDLFKKLDIICNALEIDKTNLDNSGSDILCHAAVNCGLFKDGQEHYKMNLGICKNYLKRHQDYCRKVYAVDKKVARLSEEERIQEIRKLEMEAETLQNFDEIRAIKSKIDELKKNAMKERKYDDYDSICSVDNYLNEYPELIPRNIEELKENDIINLSQKNRMDLIHQIKDPINLEGCYVFDTDEYKNLVTAKIELEKIIKQKNKADADLKAAEAEVAKADQTKADEVKVAEDKAAAAAAAAADAATDAAAATGEVERLETAVEGILDEKLSNKLLEGANNLQTCNKEAEKKGFEYFGLMNDDTCYGFEKNDLKDMKRTSGCNSKERKGDTIGIFVSKVVHPGENIVSDCWNNVINSYPYQSPGVWLHPFVNNIRICFTTNTPDDYNTYINDFSHANKGNPANVEVKKVIGKIDEHAAVQPPMSSEKGCSQGTVSLNNNYYREYFDIFNIPINNEFHLAIVVNGKSVEIYQNGELKQTITLFGNPTINQGELQISPEKNPKLGGTVKEFKYFPYSIDYQNINKIIENRRARQSLGGEPLMVPQDHGHHMEISHTHEFHPLEESNHKHSVGSDDVSKAYY